MSPKLLILAAAGTMMAMPAAAQMGGRSLSATLRGNFEVPGPGKLDAGGSANVRINPGQTRLCYTLSTRNIPRTTMAHIHHGAALIAGPPVVTLRVRSNASVSACVPVDRQVARDLIRNPGGFYVNVHSAAFPGGAVRGQLHK